MAKTELFSRKQSGGAFSIYDEGKTTGNIFWVHSGTGEDSVSRGQNPDAPLATLDYAIGLCTANKKDRIILMPGHAETYTTTGTKVTFDIAGVEIIGLGIGADRPTFTFSHTGATWVWSAAGVRLCNVLLVTGIDSVVTFCTISGPDATLDDIETRDTTDIEVVDAFITTAAAERLTVRRHFHNGYTGGNANARVWKLVGVDRAIFEDCRWITKVTTAVVNFVTTACTAIEIKRCLFLVDSTTDYSKNVVDTVSGSTWAVVLGFDLGAGAAFGGGSGAAVGVADVSTITNALYGATGIVSWPAAAAPANGVSLAEGLRWLDDAVQGANGVVTFPAAAAPANGVSLAEVIRAIYDAVAQNSAATISNITGFGRMVTKTEDVNVATGVDLFTVTGKVLIRGMFGEVTNAIGAAVTDYKLRIKTDNIDLCAAGDISTDAIGTLYSLTGDATDSLVTGAEGIKAVDHSDSGMANRVVGLAGGSCVIQSNRTAGDASDAIIWTLWYIPLEANASVAAA